ncbi:ACT domain protein [uncultured archaeon]|nr:ACT domain protein [uncultured archaeon]
MKPITVITNDRVGLISDISYVLGKARINIEALDATVVGKKIVITVIVKNYEKAKEELEKNGYPTTLDKDYCVVKILDAPGSMAKMTELLKKARINILQLHQISSDGTYALVALKTNKPRPTREILKENFPMETV